MKEKCDLTKEELRKLLAEEGQIQPTDSDVNDAEDALLALAKSVAKTPPLSIKSKILAKINALNAQAAQRTPFTLDNLPILTADANWLDWQEAVAAFEPPATFDNIHLHNIESNEKRELFVAWVKEFVPEEVHHDLLESFILLEGTCSCDIWDEAGNYHQVTMRAGDYIEMKLGETHIINITSAQPAKAILQWLKIAA